MVWFLNPDGSWVVTQPTNTEHCTTGNEYGVYLFRALPLTENRNRHLRQIESDARVYSCRLAYCTLPVCVPKQTYHAFNLLGTVHTPVCLALRTRCCDYQPVQYLKLCPKPCSSVACRRVAPQPSACKFRTHQTVCIQIDYYDENCRNGNVGTCKSTLAVAASQPCPLPSLNDESRDQRPSSQCS